MEKYLIQICEDVFREYMRTIHLQSEARPDGEQGSEYVQDALLA